MAKILSGSIDLNKIDKTKLVKTDKNGQPFQNGAVYLNVQVAINDEVDDYGNNASVSINQSKEEREAGNKKTYIGNLKEVWSNEKSNAPAQASTSNQGGSDYDPDLGF